LNLAWLSEGHRFSLIALMGVVGTELLSDRKIQAMKKILITSIITLYAAILTQAQSELIPNNLPPLPMQSPQPILSQFEAVKSGRNRILPDGSIAVLPNNQDGPLPCPTGIGKPCALLGGRLYFNDPSHMTEHDATLGKAMRNPMMVVGGLFNLASTIADIEGTQACLSAHACTEGNPMFGRNPSRARSYGLGMPMIFAVYAMSSWMKKHGEGNLAFGLLWGGTMTHVYEAAHAYALANTGSPVKTKSSAAQGMGMTIRF
jgi:hypothetical protein